MDECDDKGVSQMHFKALVQPIKKHSVIKDGEITELPVATF